MHAGQSCAVISVLLPQTGGLRPSRCMHGLSGLQEGKILNSDPLPQAYRVVCFTSTFTSTPFLTVIDILHFHCGSCHVPVLPILLFICISHCIIQ